MYHECIINELDLCFLPNFQLWQAFVGIKARRVEKYYQDLLTSETNSDNKVEQRVSESESKTRGSATDATCVPEKWKGQIEKVIHYTVL